MYFRWYGKNDSISLSQIRQIGYVQGVVTALYSVPVGEIWPLKELKQIKSQCEQNSLEWEVVESVPVHEDIKLGLKTRDYYIDNYCKNIENLSKIGIRCICYNFMPVFDWVRTDLSQKNQDNSTSLAYSNQMILKLDPKHLSLPGWDASYIPEQLSDLLKSYQNISREQLFENFVYFLKKIIPVCEKCNVNMAVHPDDPPWSLFGLPRIVSNEQDLDKLFQAVPSTRNGLTFCTGSLGANVNNNLIEMAKKYVGQQRIHFVHLRNIKYAGEKSFSETTHKSSCGSLDMKQIVTALVQSGFNGYVQPDHGRNIWSENGKPGYGLYDRALGAAYLSGLFEMIEK